MQQRREVTLKSKNTNSDTHISDPQVAIEVEEQHVISFKDLA